MKKSIFYALLAGSALCVGLFGCGGGNSAPSGPGRIRVVNALPSFSTRVEGIDVYQTTPAGQPPTLVATNVTYGSVSSTGAQVTSGTQGFSAFDKGTTANPVASGTPNVQPAIDQLLLVSGVASPQIANVGRINLDTGSIPTSGQARVYFLNAVENPVTQTADFSYKVNPDPTNQNINTLKEPYQVMSNENIVGVGQAAIAATLNGQTVTTNFPINGKKVYAIVLTGTAGNLTLNVDQLN